MNRIGWLDSLAQDARHACRGMRRSPAFTAIAVMTLALGIGVNAAVFTLTSAVLFKGFPLVARNDRLVYISSRGYGCCVSYPDFADWRAQAQSFEDMAVVHGVGVILTDARGFAERYDATEVSAGTFRLVGQRPIIGRDFTASDETPGAARVAILSYAFWQRRYGQDPSIVGRPMRINGEPATVVGVMPRGFSFPQNQDLWVPVKPTPDLRKREARTFWFAVGRLRDGVAIDNARAEMDTIGRRLARDYPRTNPGNPPVVQQFHEFFVGRNAATIYGAMWGAVGFVLLIACANLANLMLARATSRSREMSVRIALGAGRGRVGQQFLVESVLLSAMGGLAGWGIATWGVRAYAIAMAYKSPWLILDYAMDFRVLAYLVAISIGTGLLFGLAPAARLSTLDVNAALKDGGRGAVGGGRGTPLSGLLVIGQVALAVVLLAAAGVMIRSFLNIYTADLGVETAHVLTAGVGLPSSKYPRVDSQIAFFDRLKTRLAALPGVEAVAIANRLPTNGSLKLPFELAGAPPVDDERRQTLSALIVGPGYFHTLGATVLSGREFSDTDDAAGAPVAIVNRRFASQFWPGEDALGKRLRLFDGATPETWLTVVGVVANIVQNDMTRQEFDPLVYVPYRQKPASGMRVFARTSVPPAGLVTAFRREVQALDIDLPIFGPDVLSERLETWNYWSNGILAALFLGFAAIALLLASAGLYALIAHSVGQRTQEIGIRIAIGASARDILALVLTQGMLPLAIGLTAGLAGSLAVNRVLRAELVRVSPADPIALVAASATLMLAATLGCLLPAVRAMRVDPVVALRHD